MINAKLPLVLVTNGAPSSLPALRYGAWLAEVMGSQVHLIGIQEKGRWRSMLAPTLAGFQAELQERGRDYQFTSASGEAEQLLPTLAPSREHLLIFGPFGRPAWHRWVRGRSMRRVMKQVLTPFIYVRQAPMQLRRILVCVGGLGYTFPVLKTAIMLAQHAQAEIELLHVVESGRYEYPGIMRTHTEVDALIGSNTPQGRNLQAALDAAHEANVRVAVRVQQGSPLQEIYQMAASGKYDLIALGSPYSSQGLRHLTTPNITARVAEHIPLPILVARTSSDGHD